MFKYFKDKIKKYTLLDFSLLKMYCFGVGIIVGVCFTDTLSNYLFPIFIVSAIVVSILLVRTYKK